MQTVTANELSEILRRDALESKALPLLNPTRVNHYSAVEREVRSVLQTPIQITVFGMFIDDLRACVEASDKTPSAYAEEILQDAQDALKRDMGTVANQLINQARWVLANMEAQS